MDTLFAVLGRILLGAYFIITGAVTVVSPEAAGALFADAGLPPQVATVAGIFEVLAGICLAVGALTRLAATGLAAWTILALIMLHPAGVTLAQVPVLLMQMGLIGGLMLVVAHSQVWWSLDATRHRARAERASLMARHREAGLPMEARAVRAEERAAGGGAEERRRWWKA